LKKEIKNLVYNSIEATKLIGPDDLADYVERMIYSPDYGPLA
jgi:hypothetical protein